MAQHPERDYAAQPSSNQLHIELHPPAAGDKVTPAANPQISTESVVDTIKPIDEVLADHQQRVAERGARHETLTNANWLPGRIAEALDREFPDLRTPEKIEQLDIKQNAAIRRQARATQPKKRPKPVRYLSPRDKGAPPHIAREIRGE